AASTSQPSPGTPAPTPPATPAEIRGRSGAYTSGAAPATSGSLIPIARQPGGPAASRRVIATAAAPKASRPAPQAASIADVAATTTAVNGALIPYSSSANPTSAAPHPASRSARSRISASGDTPMRRRKASSPPRKSIV